MKTPMIAIALLLAGLTSAAQAQPDAASKRYADDKKLCSEENNSGARMQCLRDAKAEYDKAQQNKPSAACHDCGRVTSVVVSDKDGQGSAVGLIAGGVAGALLGNQVGSGHGRQLATVAGAAGGAYAGNKVEEHVKTTKAWNVKVQYDNGTQGEFSFDKDPGYANGDLVRSANGTIVRR